MVNSGISPVNSGIGPLPKTAKWFYENLGVKKSDLIDDIIVQLLDRFLDLEERVKILEYGNIWDS